MALLAVDGGTPTRSSLLPPWPLFDVDEIAAVVDVLKSGKVNYWTGTEGRAFETEYAAFVDTRHAVALANGTVSLELLLAVHGVGAGHEVVTSPRTFMASASAAVMRGATPVFADVDRDSQNITADAIAKVLTDRTRAIIVVHLAGWPCDMDPIMDLARTHDLVVIEDCAQAHGAVYRGRQVGALGHAGSFSFCQDKILTTGGEGGLVTLDDEQRWRAAWAMKDHGKSFEAVYEREHPAGFRWLLESFGTNWRMTEMQAAIGRHILRKLPRWHAARTRNAELLIEGLSDVRGLRVPVPPADIEHAWYKFYAFVEPGALAHGWSRDRIMEAIGAEGIPCYSGSCSEIYLEKAFDGMRPARRLPVARELGETALMFLVHPTLAEGDMGDMVDAVRKVMNAAVR